MTIRLAILGSTGSIGRQALDVAARYPERIEVVALAANTGVDAIVEQARAFGVRDIALADPDSARIAAARLGQNEPLSHNVEAGPEAVAALAAHPDVDIVLNALVGAAGLQATVTALTAGKTLALANKESLVVGGELVTALAAPGQILPVDSEHSAIFQCLEGDDTRAVARIWLTASGGPFRGVTRDRLATVTAAEALAHPTWTMGPKITIDSATLMNKGLEVIEAHHLFGTPFDDIVVVVHPQSCVHSMVEYTDGSVKAHLGATDMRIPIQYALSYPQRWDAPLPPVDFRTLGSLDFAAPDTTTFGCLELACAAGRAGGTLPAVLNAANEVAVAAFLGGRCGFLDIEAIVGATVEAHDREPLESLGHIESVDAQARRFAEETLKRL
ncbi:MAG: 1-deoxy-D-xylulose-5-phosphate reductoisomerase [Coriobacteriia bacterium]|nr:1-deoxy-D-xylulose-5-phosphate reductoisomerase [Coriobacteriia bacterium]